MDISRRMKWGFGVGLMAFVAVAPLLHYSAAAALSGSGTLGSPYLITSCADFKDIADDLDAHYRLMNDIDCSTDGDTITIGDDVLAFMGSLDGNNKKITIDINNTSWSHDVAGLFNYLGGTVTDLTIDGAIITDVSTGALAGYAEYSTIDNVIVLATVQGGNNTGGLVGETSNTSISHSSVTGDVTGGDMTGGIGGNMTGSTVSDVRYQGTVSGNTYVGGIAGSHANANISRVVSSGLVQGSWNIGGLLGYCDTGANHKLELSYSMSDVEGSGDGVGGLCGFMADAYEIVNSYSRGDVTGRNEVGGIVGYNISSGDIRHTYAAGLIEGQSLVGGILGNDASSTVTITDSYWDNRVGTNPGTTDGNMQSGAVEAHWTDEMKTYALYVANESLITPWDFETVWGMNDTDNDGYPFLLWQGFLNDPSRDNDTANSSVEDAAPNNGDGNNDGIPDAEQDLVVSVLNSATGKYITLVIGGAGCGFQKSWGATVTARGADTLVGKDMAYTYPGGFLDFTAVCASAPNTETIQVYFHGLDEETYTARKYSPTTEAYFTIPEAVISTQIMDGQKVYVASYVITDGGLLDADGIENGEIVDPVGLGQQRLSAPNTGVSSIIELLSKPSGDSL